MPVPIKWASTADGKLLEWENGRPRTSPLIYTYGIDIAPYQRAAAEIALNRWERHIGKVLATPYRQGDFYADILIDVGDLEKIEFDGNIFETESTGKYKPSGLEYVEWKIRNADPAKVVAAVMLLEKGRKKEDLIEPAMHGWGHLFLLDHPEGPLKKLALMYEHLGGHIVPTPMEVKAVRARYVDK